MSTNVIAMNKAVQKEPTQKEACKQLFPSQDQVTFS